MDVVAGSGQTLPRLLTALDSAVRLPSSRSTRNQYALV
jgi:hypothetical protein